MVFQASMNVLNPVMRIRNQFLDAMAAHGVDSSDGGDGSRPRRCSTA